MFKDLDSNGRVIETGKNNSCEKSCCFLLALAESLILHVELLGLLNNNKPESELAVNPAKYLKKAFLNWAKVHSMKLEAQWCEFVRRSVKCLTHPFFHYASSLIENLQNRSNLKKVEKLQK